MSFALLCSLLLVHGSLGEIVFRCPSCTAERQAACPKLTTSCEIVREPGCGCCPVCARQKDELCGVYTPRCGSGLRCYPSANSELPLEQLIQGLGRCENKVDLEPTMTNQESAAHSGESQDLFDLGNQHRVRYQCRVFVLAPLSPPSCLIVYTAPLLDQLLPKPLLVHLLITLS
ncbi:insulin-like growth factor-binding protein 2-B [Danio aesculapii]|uniref:insulin-like growth factor-binding protein 2-B n=1 Tax=Danio aesculapii TaxID=1142201 RepID=UPI0024C06533|nr:insulin-like growth factor-binding protein 2-B [Danio aesculapii]